MSLNRGVWSETEHNRFLEAIQTHPHGPWRYVAEYVGTRDVRQVQTHAQKYYEKIDRHERGLRTQRQPCVRPEHRIDERPPGLKRPVGGSASKATASPRSPSPAEDASSNNEELPTLEESLDMLLEYMESEMKP